MSAKIIRGVKGAFKSVIWIGKQADRHYPEETEKVREKTTSFFRSLPGAQHVECGYLSTLYTLVYIPYRLESSVRSVFMNEEGREYEKEFNDYFFENERKEFLKDIEEIKSKYK